MAAVRHPVACSLALLLAAAAAATAQEQPPAGFSPLAGIVAPAGDSVQGSFSAMPGGRGAPDIISDSLRGTYALWSSSADSVSLTGRAGEVQLGSLPVVLPSGVPVPEKLWNVDASAAYSHSLGERRGYGLNLGLGSASDDLFHSIHETDIRASLFYRLPSLSYNSWLFLLSYSNNRTFFNNIPLPGVAYLLHDPDHRLDAVIGFPFLSVRWRPDDDWTLSAALAGGVDLSAEAQRRLSERLGAYARVERQAQQWLRAGRADDTDRLVFEDADARLGLRTKLGRGWGLDVSAGRAFGRSFFEAHDALSRGTAKTSLSDCWIFDARLSWRL
jgi:hypothetical protein